MSAQPVLGAIIAGGRARRFGSDKARAMLNGRCLIDHAVDDLSLLVDHVVICGRNWRDLESIEDHPAPDLGPLAGLCAALLHARNHGYSHVVSAPVDVHPFPAHIVARLVAQGPCVLAEQFLIGAWPVALAKALETHLDAGHRSMRSWIAHTGAKRIQHLGALININFPNDWARLAAAQSRRLVARPLHETPRSA